MTTPCRSCRAEVIWAVVAKSGRKMPLDPEPHPLGNVVMTGNTDAETDAPMVEIVMQGGLLADDRPLYRSHFVTCPNADAHRRKKQSRSRR